MLTTFTTSWNAYQQHISRAIAPLTASELALRAAPNQRSIGELALHIVACRAYWFTGFLGEDGGEEMQTYAGWNEMALSLGAPIPPASELVQGLERTWQFMAVRRSAGAPTSYVTPSRMNGTANPCKCRAPGWSGM